MIYLLLAVAALAAGPLTLGWLRRRAGLASALDGFVVVAIPGLVFFQFVPAAIEHGEYAVLVALTVGLVLPPVIERVTRELNRRTDRWSLILGVSGLAIHAALDGAALAMSELVGGGDSLALAVILHRLPVGLAVWWLASRTLGATGGSVALAALMAATVGGFAGGAAFTAAASGSLVILLYQAVVGGSLVHVVAHGLSAHSPRPTDRRAEGVGALVALVLITTVAFGSGGHGDGHGSAGAEFLERLYVLGAESAFALLLAYVFAGLLSAFLPSASIRWMGRGSAVSQAGRGMVVGLPFPICSCGVVPLYQSLVSRGAPPAAAMAFLVATPELGLDAVLLSIPLLGPEVTIVRVATAAVAALLVGWWVGGRLQARPEPALAEGVDVRLPSGARLRAAMRTGAGEVVDHTAPWILLGLGIAALVAPWLEGGWLAEWPSWAGVLVFAALGFPTYVCAASATPLVAALLAGGLSPGAGIAFLITGPATNISTLGVVAGLHGRSVAAAFASVLVGFAVTAGLLIDAVLPGLPVPSLGQLTEEAPSLFQVVTLVGLALLFGASVVRMGARRFVGEIREGIGWRHGHGRDDDHGHDNDDHDASGATCEHDSPPTGAGSSVGRTGLEHTPG